LGAEKGAEKSLVKGRGCVFSSSPKRLEWPHPELVHWWLLVHSNLFLGMLNFVGLSPWQAGTLPRHETLT